MSSTFGGRKGEEKGSLSTIDGELDFFRSIFLVFSRENRLLMYSKVQLCMLLDSLPVESGIEDKFCQLGPSCRFIF